MSYDESDDQISKDELLDRLDEVEEKLSDDVAIAQDLLEKYTEQNKLFLETANNDDGNEERPDTYSEDGDDVEGCNRGEEIIRLKEFLTDESYYQKRCESLRGKVQDADTSEKIGELLFEVEDLESDYDNDRNVVEDV